MAPATRRETAGEIAKRYGLAGLVRARIMARRLHLNALARRASISYNDSLDVLDPDLTAYEMSLLYPRRYFLMDPVTSRRNLPQLENRYLYNRRLAEMEAERLDAEERADRLVSRYLTRSKAKRASIATGDDKDNENKDKNEEDNNEEDDNNNDQQDKEEEEDDLLDDDMYPYDYDPAYYDSLLAPCDLPTWRHARRLYRRRLYPYHLRPLGVTTRSMERKLRGL